jgi:hypothetical protein
MLVQDWLDKPWPTSRSDVLKFMRVMGVKIAHVAKYGDKMRV